MTITEETYQKIRKMLDEYVTHFSGGVLQVHRKGDSAKCATCNPVRRYFSTIGDPPKTLYSIEKKREEKFVAEDLHEAEEG